ncbi:Uncharacterized membrane protein YoaK, UPF0700 family [Roseateles sp. YR242]|nr:Uncharacterized membrane protein YoaK, UPF0700 family [Roseateles sp. YR242]
MNLALGVLLAFNAGAVNAGGFLLLQRYTSHMTGFASQIADGLALKHPSMTATAVGAIVSFAAGAALTAALVNFARRQGIRAVYALPLVLEAALLMSFGLMGSLALSSGSAHYFPPTVLLLSFIMGLQNAVGSKSSGGSIRTTHMTGNVTDLGMELGKLLYWNRSGGGARPVVSDKERLQRSGGLLLAFIAGGIAGATGFQSAGFIFVVPLAMALLLLAAMPLFGVKTRRLKRQPASIS